MDRAAKAIREYLERRKKLKSFLDYEPEVEANDSATALHRLHALAEDEIHHGSAEDLLRFVEPESVSVSVWSPPYFVGKEYESHLDFQGWQKLLGAVIALHSAALKPGGFLAINIADILCFRDETMPRIQAEVVSGKRSPITRDDVLKAMKEHPGANRHKLAAILGCSEQTVDRRLNGNNIRGGKYDTQTRVKLIAGLIEEWALSAGLFPYDRRVWVKDAAWENSRWASTSYRAVDEFEHIFIFWKPGITKVDRERLTPTEWRDWGSRAVWQFPSVRANDDHEAKFPLELPRRIIRLLSDPGELILDCFMGSGTTAVAAVQEGRRFIGIELQKKYVDLANRQIGKMLRFPNVARPDNIGERSRAPRANRESQSSVGHPSSRRRASARS